MIFTPVLRVMGFTVVLMVTVNTQLGFPVWAEEFILCPESPARTIKCDGPDEVIDVQDAQLLIAEDKSTNHCTNPNITDRIKSGKGITCTEKLEFTNCHGRRECRVDDDLLRIHFDVALCKSYVPNIFYVRYFCYSFKEDKTIHMNNHHKAVRGQIIDLISPSFPCNMTKQIEPYTLTCTAAPERLVFNEQMKLYVQLKLVRFAPSNCTEKIYLQREGILERENKECSTETTGTGIRNELITKARGSWKISYQNTGTYGTGGVFWFRVKAEVKGHLVDLTVNCSHFTGVFVQEESCSTIHLSNQTTPSLTTITTVATTSSAAKTSAVTSDSILLSDVTTELMMKNTTNIMVLHESQGNEGGNVMLVVLGSILGLICVVGIAILCIVCLIRKRKNMNKDNGIAEQTQSISAAAYSLAASIDECKTNGDVKEQSSQNGKEEIKCDPHDNAEGTDTGDVYAKVDKSKKTAKDTGETVMDETLMVENDDLYDTAENPNCEPEDEYNSEKDDEHIYDLPNKSKNENLITNNNNTRDNALEDEDNEQTDQNAVTEEYETNEDDSEEKGQIDVTTTDLNNLSFEKIPVGVFTNAQN